MELTFAHWVYAFFIVVVLVTMAMRKETPIVCIVASLVLAWVVTGSFVKAVQAVFNSLTVAFTELLGIIAIISIIVAMAKMLEEMGCVAIMPLASLIGSGMGILNPWNLRLILDQAKVPVIVDAGVGTASDATIAMELGCSGVLMNTAIAHAQDPVLMATAMKLAVESGRAAYLAGRMPRKFYSADPSSPTTGLIGRN